MEIFADVQCWKYGSTGTNRTAIDKEDIVVSYPPRIIEGLDGLGPSSVI